MFKTTDQLKALVNERLTAAAEEIFSIFEQTLKEYEEIVFRSQQEVDQQQSLAGWKAPLQAFVPEDDAPSKQDQCENTDPCWGDQEPTQIKEEQEEQLWTAGENEEEADNKESVLNIILQQTNEDKDEEEADTKESIPNIVLVRTNKEDKGQFSHQNQDVDNKGDCLPSSSSEQLISEPDEEGCGASGPTSDCQMSEVSGDECGDGDKFHEKQPEQACESAERPHTCSICNKNFKIKSILTRHIKTHTGEKPYSCGVCAKSFIQRSYLQTHMNSHSGQKPHTCSFCGRGFTQVGNMNAHIRIHTGEKPHSCNDCGKSFREKADLLKHTIIHTGEKPYICSVCNMKFSAQSNLTRHMKTHSGDRPYSCTACGKRFIRRSHLFIHIKTHAGEKL